MMTVEGRILERAEFAVGEVVKSDVPPSSKRPQEDYVEPVQFL